jgi:hypothetical protein
MSDAKTYNLTANVIAICSLLPPSAAAVHIADHAVLAICARLGVSWEMVKRGMI